MDRPKKPLPHDLRRTLPPAVDLDADTDLTIPDFVEMDECVPTLAPGTKVGKYTIEDVLGVGGMGAVYRATQRKPKRLVALKLIRAGVLSAKSIRRFDLEAEILGRLHHPNIAQIYEAGIDQATGSPYFAMEYVAGQELGDYVKEQDLTVRDLLELFTKLCDAIQHAHAKGIIHRDLKPSNVLVVEGGEPKVLDFGVARATDAKSQAATMQTNVGQLIGTLYYMSPEQATGDTLNLDTRSDVYALGVVLYEILTGKIPYELKGKAIHEAVGVIQDTAPTKLGKLDPVLKGDIEIIVNKALAKDRELRYQSVADFSADIRRTLADQPIHARPPSVIYQSTKFMKRNSGLTITAACVAVLFTVAIGVVANQRLNRIRDRQLALDNMLSTLNLMDVQKSLGPDLTKKLLDLYSDHGETIFSSDQHQLALFYTGIGRAYHGYEDYRSAHDSYQKAYSIYAKMYDEPHPLLADALHKIASAEFYLGDFEQARLHYEQTLKMREALDQPDDPQGAEIARTLDHLGTTFAKLGDHESALKDYTRAKDIRVSLFGAGSLEVAMSNNSIAWFYIQQEKYADAVPIYREALELLQALPEDDSKPVWVARTMHSLGNALIQLEQYDEAIVYLNQSLELKQALLSGNKPSVAITLHSLAEASFRLAKFARAEEFAHQAIQIRTEIEDPRVDASRELLSRIQSNMD